MYATYIRYHYAPCKVIRNLSTGQEITQCPSEEAEFFTVYGVKEIRFPDAPTETQDVALFDCTEEQGAKNALNLLMEFKTRMDRIAEIMDAEKGRKEVPKRNPDCNCSRCHPPDCDCARCWA